MSSSLSSSSSSLAASYLRSLRPVRARAGAVRAVRVPQSQTQTRPFFWSRKAKDNKKSVPPSPPNIDRERLLNRDFPYADAEPAHPAPPTPPTPAPSQVGQLDGKPCKHVSIPIDSVPRVFDTLFLRDSCTCPSCVDPDSKQKLFQTADIPFDLEASCREITHPEKGQCVEITWLNDLPDSSPTHTTVHSYAWLRRALNTEIELRGGVRHDDRVLWDKARITADNKWTSYSSWMNDDKALFASLTHLHRYGLLFLNNVPDSDSSVINIASRIGNLKDTFYGLTWDVKSKPRAENIAYTPHFLGLHMDLLYTSNPPHLQLLHSLRARAPKGESFFSDSFAAAHKLYQTSPALFRTLCTFPVTYHYHHENFHYHYNRPTIELAERSKYSDPTNIAVKRVNWSPPFQGPFEARIGAEEHPALRSYLQAAKAYARLLNAEENLYEYRLKEGECVIFDNRRVLHARRAFDARKGERWLKGAYVDDDVFFSKLRVLQERFEGKWVAEGVVREKVE
ncbi:Clavaminate synthase-like protein [Sporormia fimetaria CBS 119925]|uniref:Clavaminate synthase-like protein n=1 Tax=Sporormia fimetaria CBS 119925 TaxID=1340428 RepID=A0A6A6VN41_9PLEO|nr:Clavaminate synthase-like protein [Sporormia fimetaria CBS 119925]